MLLFPSMVTSVSALLLVLAAFVIRWAESRPEHHHVYHRIHVPTKIKTIYRTKIIKVPEHHHHYKEKEKVKFIDLHALHHHHKSAEYDDLHDGYSSNINRYQQVNPKKATFEPYPPLTRGDYYENSAGTDYSTIAGGLKGTSRKRSGGSGTKKYQMFGSTLGTTSTTRSGKKRRRKY